MRELGATAKLISSKAVTKNIAIAIKMAVSFLIFIDNGALLSGRPQVTPTTCYILPKQTLPVIGTYAADIVGRPLVKAKADILQGNNLSKFFGQALYL